MEQQQPPSQNLLNYSTLNERETEIVKKQVKSQYERLKFRKYSLIAHLNPSSGSYKEKLKMIYAAEIKTEREFYIYVYNMLRPHNLINAELDPAGKGLRIGQLADYLKDSLWHTKKRLAETTKLMQNTLELLEDQILLKKPETNQILTDADKELVKNTVLHMINYVCETKKTLLDEVLKEDEKPMFDFSALNPFNSPVKIKLVQADEPIPVKMLSSSINGGNRRTIVKNNIRRTQKRRS
jgi:hypothetical protein